MRILTFYALVAAWLIWVFAVDRYSARGIKFAREECNSKGILRVLDRQRWRELISKSPDAHKSIKLYDYRPDIRFSRSVYSLSVSNKPIAELNILRAYTVSSLSWTGLGTPSPSFICATDVRYTEFQNLLPLFK